MSGVNTQALIPLRNAKGKVVAHATVDVEDYEELSQHSWYADWGSKNRQKVYAVRMAPQDGRRVKLRMHRVILGLPPGDPRVGHHKDDDGLNNRRSNLEILPDNHHNMRKSPGWNKPKARIEDVGF